MRRRPVPAETAEIVQFRPHAQQGPKAASPSLSFICAPASRTLIRAPMELRRRVPIERLYGVTPEEIAQLLGVTVSINAGAAAVYWTRAASHGE